jgi:polar amino acid transport system substrate-binding protein
MKKQLYIFILSLAVCCLPIQLLADSQQQNEIFNINTSVHPPTATKNHDGFEDRLAIELFTRLGFRKIIIHNVPAERGLINLNNGTDDAILTRVAGLEKTYPDIVRITEVANIRSYTAFSRKGIKLKSWDDLEKYDVAYINGWKIFDKNVKKYRSLIKVRAAEQLFGLLEKKRVDVVLYAHAAGNYMIRQLGLKDIVATVPALAKKKKYFYMHKRHTALIPEANRLLRQIKQDGTYDKLKQQTMSDYY